MKNSNDWKRYEQEYEDGMETFEKFNGASKSLRRPSEPKKKKIKPDRTKKEL